MANAPMGAGDRYYVYRSLLDLKQKFERRASREAEKAELHEWREVGDRVAAGKRRGLLSRLFGGIGCDRRWRRNRDHVADRGC
ncbi:hypothetical protein ABID44_000625 [Aquamicrobium ahrensii]|uniref:Uncharacterized protein n=1 Tax=Aquamicrobium ahrensii TaxID=469551 RepID=A0ABV2KGW3_9HYPH